MASAMQGFATVMTLRELSARVFEPFTRPGKAIAQGLDEMRRMSLFSLAYGFPETRRESVFLESLANFSFSFGNAQ